MRPAGRSAVVSVYSFILEQIFEVVNRKQNFCSYKNRGKTDVNLVKFDKITQMEYNNKTCTKRGACNAGGATDNGNAEKAVV